MKKFTSIAAAMVLATAFSGFCAGCASSVKENKDEDVKNAAVAVAEDVSASAAGDSKVILCPGWNYQGSTKKLNTLSGTGVTAMTASQAEDATNGYWVENAYIFEAAAGTELPEPTAGKSGIEFVGWRVAIGGVPTTVTEMPSGSTVQILYAEWKAEGSGNNNSGNDDDVGTPSTICFMRGEYNGTTDWNNGWAMNTVTPTNGAQEQYQLNVTVSSKLEFKIVYNGTWTANVHGDSTASYTGGGDWDNAPNIVLFAGSYTIIFQVWGAGDYSILIN